jgi:hypothetical protein
MIVIPDREPVTPGVKGSSKLREAAYCFKLQSIKVEAHILAAVNFGRWNFRVIGKPERLAGDVTVFLDITVGDRGTRISRVNPIVDSIEQPIDAKLWVPLRETGQHHAPNVGAAVAVAVFGSLMRPEGFGSRG